MSWTRRAIILGFLTAAAVLLVVLPDGSSSARTAVAARPGPAVTDYAVPAPGARYAVRLHTAERLSYATAERLRAERLARKAATASSAGRQQAGSAPPASPGTGTFPGALSPAQVGAYWLEAGGPRWSEATAECIAFHESGDVPSKVSPTDDWGLWQINAGNAGMSVGGTTIVISTDPLVSARDAVALSRGGTDWSAWTTHADCGV